MWPLASLLEAEVASMTFIKGKRSATAMYKFVSPEQVIIIIRVRDGKRV